MTTKLEIPAIGWQTAVEPCTECRRIVTEESRKSIFSGQQHDCYNCNNRMTVKRIAQYVPTAAEMLSAFADTPGTHQVKLWRVVEVSFDDRFFARTAMQDWMAHYGLEGFDLTKQDLGWSIFSKETDQDASTLVLLDDGVVGLCLLEPAEAI